MLSRIGEKGYLTAFAQKLPGIIVTEPVPATYTTRDGRELPTWRANVITLRPTNPANGPVEFRVRQSNEDVGGSFWFPRTKAIVGLDADEHGAVLDIEDLSDAAMAFTLEQQAIRMAAQADPEIAF